MAFYGWPIAQCQSPTTPLDVQLASGIRLLDIRLSLVKGRLLSFHDVYPQREPFQSILSTLHTFLAGPSSRGHRETVVVSIKQEDYRTVDAHVFSAAVRAEIEESAGGIALWFLEPRVPTLGEVRGKCVLFSRFGADGAEWEHGLDGLGIHPRAWPDSARDGFVWECGGTLVRTHDWYRVPSFLSIPEKVERATAVLLPARAAPVPVLNVSFLSASSFPLAAPPTIARGFGWPARGFGVEGVNARVGRWLLGKLTGEGAERLAPDGEKGYGDEKHAEDSEDEDDVEGKPPRADEPRVRGWVLMDFFRDPGQGIVPLLIETNFRGRRHGEEGWP